MRRRTTVTAALVGIGILACGLLWALWPADPEPMRLEITGTSGTTVSGKYEVEGKVHQLSGVVPFTIDVSAASVTYDFHKAAQAGDLRAKLTRLHATATAPGRSVSASTSGPFRGVRGGIRKGRGWDPTCRSPPLTCPQPPPRSRLRRNARRTNLCDMAKKGTTKGKPTTQPAAPPASRRRCSTRGSSTAGDNLEQLAKLPDRCVDLMRGASTRLR